MVIPTPKNTTQAAIKFWCIPPFLKEAKNPGPTCNPMEYMNRINPNSRIKFINSGLALKPKCPTKIPTNKTKVTPRDTPKIFTLPIITPTAITKAYNNKV